MILRDYRCPDHGLFESAEEQCPETGCAAAVTIAFLKPVGHVSARTKGFDRDLRLQAESFGMSNLRSAREGENQIGFLPDSVAFGDPEPPTKMPDNIKWGTYQSESGTTHSIAGVTGGAGKADIALATPSPLRAFNMLEQKTVFSHTAPGIKKTAAGLTE